MGVIRFHTEPAKRTDEISEPLPNAHALTVNEVLDRLQCTSNVGLNAVEVKRRRQRYGANRLRASRPVSSARILYNQFKSLIVLLLGIAAGLSFLFDHWVEGLAIVAVILINAAIGFFTELRAVRSMEALRRLSVVLAKVRRNEHVVELPAEQLVPGDIVIVEGGDIVSADLRLLEASKLQCDESVLTGESLPIMKHTDPLPHAEILPDRVNMAFQGTAVTRGSGEGVVVATGMVAELGRIAALVETAEQPETPLEKRIDHLCRQLVWVTAGLTLIIGAVGILTGKPPLLMIETAIALAVATVPEGLPMVATLALARGMWRMARRNALIERLAAVETLGATSIILTDKTGTMTENRMTVTHIALASGDISVASSSSQNDTPFTRDNVPLDPSQDEALHQLLDVCVLCNNASLSPDSEHLGETKIVGDPMEAALLILGVKAGIEREGLLKDLPEVREEAFDPDFMMMATVHDTDGGYLVAVKGAPEALLDRASHILTPSGSIAFSEQNKSQWRNRAADLANEGLRLLAFALKTAETSDVPVYQGLTFLGLAGLFDPPRDDVADAIAACNRAGIRVVMATGDHLVTAKQIAGAVGLVDYGHQTAIDGSDLPGIDKITEQERRTLLDAAIFARVSPKQKLDLIALHKQAGSIVAMTGDGVNDAPALRLADIGIAMGQRGSQVAREAADMVLRDDAFGTIVAAIAQGRVIFANIRKFIIYLLSCNLSEIMVVGLASLAGLPLPILPLQILYLNLVTDVFPAFALGASEGEADVMKRLPRDPAEALLPTRHWIAIVTYAAAITAATLSAFVLSTKAFDMTPDHAVTVSFLTLALSQLWHVFNMRDRGSKFLRNEITQNRYVWSAIALCLVLILIAVYAPGLASVLKLSPPPADGLWLAAGLSLLPWAIGQIAKSVPRAGE